LDTTRLSSKGQVILPKAVRDAHNWRPGTDFALEEMGEGVLLRPLKPFPPTRIEDVAGCLRHKGRPKTVAEMDRGIAREVERRRARGRY
jgi:AbrB family looped-hinge helix DNA binding protein